MLEIEIKLRLESAEAARTMCRRLNLPWQDGVFERNRIFDFPDGRLRQRGALVRIRERGPEGFLTYKEKSAEPILQAKVRLEYDTAVSDTVSAMAIVTNLGLAEVMTYERFRARHKIGAAHLEIDCVPGGWFCEIEGSPGDIARIKKESGLEGLTPVVWSYPEIFAGMTGSALRPIRDWTFEAFSRGEFSLPPFGDAFWLRAAREA